MGGVSASPTGRTWLLGGLALAAFAANSILCRMALRPGLVDAATFTAVRLGAGALVLALLVRARPRTRAPAERDPAAGGSWRSALALFLYAAPFSFAYLRLDAGVGALALFGSVQVTMIGVGVARGERPGALEWLGLGLALAGLVSLVLRGTGAPDLVGVALMALAGTSWGLYSLRGRAAVDATAATAGNFLRAAPLGLGLLLAVGAASWAGATSAPHVSAPGLLLALASGALTSGLGYALWYSALPGLSATHAAIVQLTVPVLTAAAGVVALGEHVTPRSIGASAAILGGVALAVLRRRRG